jgi:hypothetical protein
MKPNLLVSIVLTSVSLAAGSALACSDKDWKACKGKSWVIGETMEKHNDRR